MISVPIRASRKREPGRYKRLFERMSRLQLRTVVSDAGVEQRTNAHRKHGILFGV